MVKVSLLIILILIFSFFMCRLRSLPFNNKLINRTIASEYKSPEFSKNLLYRFYKPVLSPNTSYPLVLILHSSGERGNDNAKQIERMAKAFLSDKLQKKHPSFILIPQCGTGSQWVNTTFKAPPYDHYIQAEIPESEEMQMIIRVMKDIVSEFSIDPKRIYVVGLSMGSSGTWDIITRHTDIFAAAIPISGVSDTSVAYKIQNTSVWAFNGMLDSIAPVRLNAEMQKAILKSGGNCKLTLYKGVGHYCLPNVLREPDLFNWLFSHKR